MRAGKIDKLVKMANQIGDFFAPMPEREAMEGVATHLRRYWTPKMICEIIDYADTGGGGLHPVTARAVELLKQHASTRTEIPSRAPRQTWGET